MKKAKKLVALTTAAVMAASMLTACGGGSSSSTATQAPADTAAAEGGASGDAAASGDYEEIELVFSHINAETHTWHKMAEKFKELIEERSGGKITVTITRTTSLVPRSRPYSPPSQAWATVTSYSPASPCRPTSRS